MRFYSCSLYSCSLHSFAWHSFAWHSGSGGSSYSRSLSLVVAFLGVLLVSSAAYANECKSIASSLKENGTQIRQCNSLLKRSDRRLNALMPRLEGARLSYHSSAHSCPELLAVSRSASCQPTEAADSAADDNGISQHGAGQICQASAPTGRKLRTLTRKCRTAAAGLKRLEASRQRLESRSTQARARAAELLQMRPQLESTLGICKQNAGEKSRGSGRNPASSASPSPSPSGGDGPLCSEPDEPCNLCPPQPSPSPSGTASPSSSVSPRTSGAPSSSCDDCAEYLCDLTGIALMGESDVAARSSIAATPTFRGRQNCLLFMTKSLDNYQLLCEGFSEPEPFSFFDPQYLSGPAWTFLDVVKVNNDMRQAIYRQDLTALESSLAGSDQYSRSLVVPRRKPVLQLFRDMGLGVKCEAAGVLRMERMMKATENIDELAKANCSKWDVNDEISKAVQGDSPNKFPCLGTKALFYCIHTDHGHNDGHGSGPHAHVYEYDAGRGMYLKGTYIPEEKQMGKGKWVKMVPDPDYPPRYVKLPLVPEKS